jgi:hypothetical protein
VGGAENNERQTQRRFASRTLGSGQVRRDCASLQAASGGLCAVYQSER